MLLGLDLGTTNVKALVTDLSGRRLAEGACPVRLWQEGPDWVEQDLEEIWGATLHAIQQAFQSVEPEGIRAVGVSSQGGALQLTDGQHRPVGRVVSWLDGRGRSFAAELTAELGEQWFVRRIGHARAGLAIGQFLRLLRECPAQLAVPNRAGFVGDLIVERLCGQTGHDGTSCSLTALYDPAKRDYAVDVLARLHVAWEQLPPLFSPRTAVAGLLSQVARETGLRAGIPVSPAIHDQYAAALAAAAVQPGTAMVGTGTAWVVLAITESLSKPATDLAFCCHHVAENLWGQIVSMGNGGSAVAWALRLTGHQNTTAGALDDLISSVPPGSDRLRCWPFFAPGAAAGLATDLGARLAGLRLLHTPAHVLRAVVEGLSYELARHLDLLRTAGIPVDRMILSGPAAANRITPEILASATGLPLTCADPNAGSPLGAAILARGLLEPGTPLRTLAEQMTPASRRVEVDLGASLYPELFQEYVRSLPLIPPSHP